MSDFAKLDTSVTESDWNYFPSSLHPPRNSWLFTFEQILEPVCRSDMGRTEEVKHYSECLKAVIGVYGTLLKPIIDPKTKKPLLDSRGAPKRYAIQQNYVFISTLLYFRYCQRNQIRPEETKWVLLLCQFLASRVIELHLKPDVIVDASLRSQNIFTGTNSSKFWTLKDLMQKNEILFMERLGFDFYGLDPFSFLSILRSPEDDIDHSQKQIWSQIGHQTVNTMCEFSKTQIFLLFQMDHIIIATFYLVLLKNKFQLPKGYFKKRKINPISHQVANTIYQSLIKLTSEVERIINGNSHFKWNFEIPVSSQIEALINGEPLVDATEEEEKSSKDSEANDTNTTEDRIALDSSAILPSPTKTTELEESIKKPVELVKDYTPSKIADKSKSSGHVTNESINPLPLANIPTETVDVHDDLKGRNLTVIKNNEPESQGDSVSQLDTNNPNSSVISVPIAKEERVDSSNEKLLRSEGAMSKKTSRLDIQSLARGDHKSNVLFMRPTKITPKALKSIQKPVQKLNKTPYTISDSKASLLQKEADLSTTTVEPKKPGNIHRNIRTPSSIIHSSTSLKEIKEEMKGNLEKRKEVLSSSQKYLDSESAIELEEKVELGGSSIVSNTNSISSKENNIKDKTQKPKQTSSSQNHLAVEPAKKPKRGNKVKLADTSAATSDVLSSPPVIEEKLQNDTIEPLKTSTTPINIPRGSRAPVEPVKKRFNRKRTPPSSTIPETEKKRVSVSGKAPKPYKKHIRGPDIDSISRVLEAISDSEISDLD